MYIQFMTKDVHIQTIVILPRDIQQWDYIILVLGMCQSFVYLNSDLYQFSKVKRVIFIVRYHSHKRCQNLCHHLQVTIFIQ